jgi:hypothetical protein
MPPENNSREIETLEETACRLEMIVRQIYFIAKDAEEYGFTDHNTLEDFTNSLLYTAIEYEKRIKRMSENRPTKRPVTHGNALKHTKTLEESLKRQHENLRKYCNDRINKKT